jgi:Phage protein (N4 Gp49/phage Sf6 gene 66) family
MTQFYIGVKIIEAWEEVKDGNPGYGVKYPDGYVSWSPKKAFEDAYFLMGIDESRVTREMVDNFLKFSEAFHDDNRTTLVKTILLSGFKIIEASSCVDPKNFDHETGKEICRKRTRDKICEYLGFVLQWGRFGLKQNEYN